MTNLFLDNTFPMNIVINGINNNNIIWKRPKEICKNPKMFCDGLSRFDIVQGQLGDCWFMAALSNLSQKPHILKKVIPEQPDFDSDYYNGMFRFNFWHYGKWVEIIIDDRLPTYNNEIVFAKSSIENEFWCSLVEKAYAKFNGSYKSLEGGYERDAIVDCTGGISYNINKKGTIETMFNEVITNHDHNKIIFGCSFVKERNVSGRREGEGSFGLISGHAYSITAIEDVKYKNGTTRKMIRVRNPWGNQAEWNGRFSDKDFKSWNEVKDDEKVRIGFINKPDGEFWMLLEDFLLYVENIDVCFVENPDDNKPLMIYNDEGSWIRNITSGGLINSPDFEKNPQYVLKTKETCEVYISLIQKVKRSVCLNTKLCGFNVFEFDTQINTRQSYNSLLSVNMSTKISLTYNRECSDVLYAEKGKNYVIIPFIYEKTESADYLLRILTKNVEVNLYTLEDDIRSEHKEHDNEEINNNIPYYLLQEPIRIHELHDIIENIFKIKLELSTCRYLIMLNDSNQNGIIDSIELRDLLLRINRWIKLFKSVDVDKNGVLSYYEFRNSQISYINNDVWSMFLERDGRITITNFIEFMSYCTYYNLVDRY